MEENRIRDLLLQIYGEEQSVDLVEHVERILRAYRPLISKQPVSDLSERDAILITYPDQVQESRRPDLVSLAEFCKQYLTGLFSGIHILPFYPWSSDDGFSVIDYRAVAPEYGKWKDVIAIGSQFHLMFDAVINHASAHSSWFEGFLTRKQPYSDYFIEVKGNPDLSRVVRPRTLPLLTRFNTSDGEKTVWTTFSEDQIDLNYHDPKVLLEIIDLLLFYVSNGAEFIRLDAIAYLWKEFGTSCIHLPKTHAIVRLFRAILDEIAPKVKLISETNVSHAENLSYFGDGFDEAQLVYNFALPPLILHTFQTGSVTALSKWAVGLRLPSERVTYLNILASHDGIGLNAVRGILDESEIDDLARRAETRRGRISYKTSSDGKQCPYELNVNYFDALEDPEAHETLAMKVDRFISAHAILLAFKGIPAIYFHSMFGSRGWLEGVALSGQNRSINRQKLERGQLQSELANDNTLRAQIYLRMSHLLRVRATEPAFSPVAAQRVVESGRHVFVLLRLGIEKPVLCLFNVSAELQEIDLESTGTLIASTERYFDLITGKVMDFGKSMILSLEPYQFCWLKY